MGRFVVGFREGGAVGVQSDKAFRAATGDRFQSGGYRSNGLFCSRCGDMGNVRQRAFIQPPAPIKDYHMVLGLRLLWLGRPILRGAANRGCRVFVLLRAKAVRHTSTPLGSLGRVAHSLGTLRGLHSCDSDWRQRERCTGNCVAWYGFGMPNPRRPWRHRGLDILDCSFYPQRTPATCGSFRLGSRAVPGIRSRSGHRPHFP